VLSQPKAGLLQNTDSSTNWCLCINNHVAVYVHYGDRHARSPLWMAPVYQVRVLGVYCIICNLHSVLRPHSQSMDYHAPRKVRSFAAFDVRASK
jgi:hypothetical protein